MNKRRLEKLRVGVQAMIEHPNPTSDMHWKVDGELHGAIAEASGNAVMASVIANLRLITQLFEVQTVPRRITPGGAEHLAILDALIAGDPKMARKAMRFHLDRVRAGVMDDL